MKTRLNLGLPLVFLLLLVFGLTQFFGAPTTSKGIQEIALPKASAGSLFWTVIYNHPGLVGPAILIGVILTLGILWALPFLGGERALNVIGLVLVGLVLTSTMATGLTQRILSPYLITSLIHGNGLPAAVATYSAHISATFYDLTSIYAHLASGMIAITAPATHLLL